MNCHHQILRPKIEIYTVGQQNVFRKVIIYQVNGVGTIQSTLLLRYYLFNQNHSQNLCKYLFNQNHSQNLCNYLFNQKPSQNLCKSVQHTRIHTPHPHTLFSFSLSPSLSHSFHINFIISQKFSPFLLIDSIFTYMSFFVNNVPEYMRGSQNV